MKKFIALFLALFCASVLMAQEFVPVENTKDVLGKWEGVYELDESAVTAAMGIGELPAELSFLRFEADIKLGLQFKTAKKDVYTKTETVVTFYIRSDEKMPDELIEMFKLGFQMQEQQFDVAVNKAKTEIAVSQGDKVEETVTAEQFEAICSEFLISKDKKILLMIDETGNGLELNKKK